MNLSKRLLIFLILGMTLLAGTTSAFSAEDPVQKVKELRQRISQLDQQGRYAEAVQPAKELLIIYEKNLGPEHPNTATALNNLAGLYKAIGSYDKAEPLYKRALAIDEKSLGPEHPNTATVLNNLAGLYKAIGSYDKAEPLYKRALAIDEKSLGAEHSRTATVLGSLAMLYVTMGSYDKAEPLYHRALAIFEKSLGPDHPHTATTLISLAELYKAIGSYDKAEPLYKRTLGIYEKALGSEHPHTAAALNGLAELYLTMGSYDKAEPLYNRALAIFEKSLGPDHPHTATALNNLAGLYVKMGWYDRAEPLYKRALITQEKVLGPEHPSTALTLNGLAEIYLNMGSYDKAEPLYKRSLAIREKNLGPEHPNTATALNNLAMLYVTMGSYDKAEPLYKRSLAIREKAQGPDHPHTATALNNLASLYSTMGSYDKAEPLFKSSLAINETALGPNHPDMASSLNALALLYVTMGYYDKAEPLFKRSLAIREKALEPEHPNTATALNNLAGLYKAIGSYDKAEPLYKRALTIFEKSLGPDHPHTATALNGLAVLYVNLGRSIEALKLTERAQRIDRRQIDQILGFASEEQQSRFLAKSEGNMYGYLTLVRQHFQNHPIAIKSALDIWLARKGILLEAQMSIRDMLTTSENPKAKQLFNELTAVKEKLARLVLGSPGKEGMDAYRKRIEELTAQKESIEGHLSRLSQSFARQRKTRDVTSTTTASALPKGSILVETARIRDYDFKTGKWGRHRYISFVLPCGSDSKVSMIDLGNAENIDRKVADFKKSLGNSKTPADILAKQGTDIYKLVFAPLTSALGESKKIFLSPDGSLNLIPYELLRDDRGGYLIDSYAFNYVAAGRDIAGYGMIKEKGRKALLMGDPDYNLAYKQAAEEKERPLIRSRNMQGLTFSRLPGTREEVETVASILGRSQCDTYTGEMARESVLMQSKSPRILHLATHGFFLSDQEWSSMIDDKTRGIAITDKSMPSAKGKLARIENPFLRSGLALAGANRSLSQEGANEGILTAEKILGVNLRGTDLVVLSACETGLGDVKNGEGVYGLRRAFTQAGAKSLVMSLWEVPDKETKELMVSFYKNLQSGKMNRAEALRNAALKQRQIVKSRYGNDNPYYWGAFVFLGEAE